jgi:hypothetical protein
MLFISYWELNQDFDPTELAEMAQKLISKKLVPYPGVKQLAWYISPEYWGITISEAESEAAIFEEQNMWRIARPGVFKFIKTTVGMEITKVIPLMAKLAKKIRE